MQVRDDTRLVHGVDVFSDAAARHQVRRNHQAQRFDADARPIGDDEIAQTQQRLVFLPHRNIQKRVGANDEVDAVAVPVIRVPKIAHRIHGIVKLRAAEIVARFGHRRNEVRVLGARQRHHRKSMRKWSQVLLQLVRRPAGRHEMNLIEIESPVGGARHGEMAVVNRVERSAKQRDAARMMFCGGALRLRGGQYASQGPCLYFLTDS